MCFAAIVLIVYVYTLNDDSSKFCVRAVVYNKYFEI